MSKKIVVIDDEPDILKVVIFRLKKLGHTIMSATDGKSGLDLIMAEKPDLIVVDYRLPIMDGVEVAKRVRSDDELKNTPVILITASSGEKIEELAKKANVNDYLKKPFDPEQLLAIVNKYL